MTGVKQGDFEGAVGESWEVDGPEGTIVPLTLEVVQPLPRATREGGAFRLEWSGPGDLVLPQATYAFSRGGERSDIFIVPIARVEDRIRYEALFM
ncbi:MAG TPA: hypothetical protein VGC56_19270 [Allosphingosinicella sp.]|jgi:hypothetical protein